MDAIEKLEIVVTFLFAIATATVTYFYSENESLLVGLISSWVFFYLLMGFVGFRHWRVNRLIPLAFFGLYWFAATVLLTLLFRIQGWEPLTEMVIMSLLVLLIGLVPMGLYVYLQKRRNEPLHPQYFRLATIRTGIMLAVLVLLAVI